MGQTLKSHPQHRARARALAPASVSPSHSPTLSPSHSPTLSPSHSPTLSPHTRLDSLETAS
jgi:hypothetical protein